MHVCDIGGIIIVKMVDKKRARVIATAAITVRIRVCITVAVVNVGVAGRL